MAQTWDTASACNGVRTYADGETGALLILRGENDGAHDSLEYAFMMQGAVLADLESSPPGLERSAGLCRIRPTSVEVELEGLGGFSFCVEWGETSTWWTHVAWEAGHLYVGLLHRDEFQRAVEGTFMDGGAGVAAMGQPVFPPMRCLKFDVEVR
jgi:hypothetical protein